MLLSELFNKGHHDMCKGSFVVRKMDLIEPKEIIQRKGKALCGEQR